MVDDVQILVSFPHQRTPLHLAVSEGHVDTVQYLVSVGGDISIQDNSGVSE